MSIMNEIFREHLDVLVILYLDDILVYSKTFTDHLKHLEIVLEILRNHKLFEKLSKCVFAAAQV